MKFFKILGCLVLLVVYSAESLNAEPLTKPIEPKFEDLIFFKLGETLMAAPKLWVTDVGLEGLSVDKKISSPLRKAIKSKEPLIDPIPLAHLNLLYRPEYPNFKPSDTPYAPYYLESVPYFIVVSASRRGGLIPGFKKEFSKLKKNKNIKPDKFGYLRVPRIREALNTYYKERLPLKWGAPEDNIKQVECKTEHDEDVKYIYHYDCQTFLTWLPFQTRDVRHRIRYDFRRNKFPKEVWEDLDEKVIKLLNQMKLWAEIHKGNRG